MTIREQNIERFDAYVKGKLIGDDKALFEQELLKNEVLNADFEAYKAEVMLIKTLGIRDEMGQVMASKSATKKTGQRRWLIPLGVAAALALTLLFLPKKAVDADSMFDEYFVVYPNAITSRAQEGDVHEALESYEGRDYEKAIELFDLLEETDTVSFYKSMSQLGLKQPQQAVSGLGKIENSSIFYNPSIWYRGLGFLLMDERDSAIYYMQQVKESGPNREEASEILSRLSKARGNR